MIWVRDLEFLVGATGKAALHASGEEEAVQAVGMGRPRGA